MNATKDPELINMQKSIFASNKTFDSKNASASKRKKKNSRYTGDFDSGDEKQESLPMTRLEE